MLRKFYINCHIEVILNEVTLFCRIQTEKIRFIENNVFFWIEFGENVTSFNITQYYSSMKVNVEFSMSIHFIFLFDKKTTFHIFLVQIWYFRNINAKINRNCV